MVPTNCLDVSQNGCLSLYYISMKNFQTLRCTCEKKKKNKVNKKTKKDIYVLKASL